MNEKAFKTMARGGIVSLVLGILILILGIITGVLMVIHGALLLRGKNEITF